MRYIVDHDFHIHTGGSMCSGDPNQTPGRILQYAIDEGFSAVALTDHFWDERVEMNNHSWFAGWYAQQNYEHIAQNLPLPQAEGVEFLFGVENYEVSSTVRECNAQIKADTSPYLNRKSN